jgi:RNA polymerase sigma factor for flagellar operon FliA
MMAAAEDALLERIAKYNPDRGVKFEAFASPRIRFALIDRLRALVDVGRLEWDRGAAAQEAANRLAHELGRQPTTEEREALPEVRAWRKGQRRPHTTSLDVTKFRTDFSDKAVTEEMLLDARHVRGHRPTVRKAFFEELLRSLDTEQRIIMWARYRIGRSMKETGEFLGLSESRVSQMHSEVLRQIRKRLDAGEAWDLLAMSRE